MIFYFSGTGNSKAIAEEIADYIGTEAVDIIAADVNQIHLENEEYVGFTSVMLQEWHFSIFRRLFH